MIPVDWKPAITLDDQTQLAIRLLAKPFHGQVNLNKLCDKVRELIVEKFPAHAIGVHDYTQLADRLAKRINLLVWVDGKPDQGVVIGYRAADGSIYGTPAND